MMGGELLLYPHKTFLAGGVPSHGVFAAHIPLLFFFLILTFDIPSQNIYYRYGAITCHLYLFVSLTSKN